MPRWSSHPAPCCRARCGDDHDPAGHRWQGSFPGRETLVCAAATGLAVDVFRRRARYICSLVFDISAAPPAAAVLAAGQSIDAEVSYTFTSPR